MHDHYNNFNFLFSFSSWHVMLWCCEAYFISVFSGGICDNLPPMLVTGYTGDPSANPPWLRSRSLILPVPWQLEVVRQKCMFVMGKMYFIWNGNANESHIAVIKITNNSWLSSCFAIAIQVDFRLYLHNIANYAKWKFRERSLNYCLVPFTSACSVMV